MSKHFVFLAVLALASPALAGQDLFRGKTARVDCGTDVIFRVGFDKYVTLRSTDLLKGPPSVTAPAGMTAKVVSFDVREEKVSRTSVSHLGRTRTTTKSTGTGYVFRCTVEVSAQDALKQGKHTVKVSWGAIGVAGALLKANPDSSGNADFTVDFWESEASKKAFLAAEAARKAEENFRGWMRVLAWVAGIIGAIVAFCYLMKLLHRTGCWWFPASRIKVKAGEPERVRTTVVKEIPLKLEDLDKPLEPIVQSKQALGFWGGTTGVTVNVYGQPVDAEYTRTTNTMTRNGSVVNVWFTYSAKVTYEMTVTAEAKEGVRPGTALADTEAGLVKVQVLAA